MVKFDRTNPIISAQLRNLRWAIGNGFYHTRAATDDTDLEEMVRKWIETNLDASWNGEVRHQIIDAAIEDMIGPAY